MGDDFNAENIPFVEASRKGMLPFILKESLLSFNFSAFTQ